MDPATQLSGLIGDIHDAALDEALWSEVVGQAGRFVGGPSAAIFSKSAVAGTGDVHYQVGIEAHWRQLYFEKYVRLDPATVGHQLAEIGQPIGVEDLMPYPEFAQSRFYREWARPQGIVDFASAVLDKSPTGAAMFGVFRYEGDGIVDGDARRRMQLIVPHIRRALTVGRLFERKSTGSAAFEALDGLSTGVCLLDTGGKIIQANAACRLSGYFSQMVVKTRIASSYSASLLVESLLIKVSPRAKNACSRRSVGQLVSFQSLVK